MEDQRIPEDIYQQVKVAYVKTLLIPEHKSEKQFFLCPVGYIGAGKSTILDLLCQHFDFVRLSGDEIRRLLRERGYGKAGLGEPQRMLDEVVEKFASKGYNIAFDSNCGSVRAKEAIETRAKRLGAKTFWIHINPPEKFILEKLKNFKHSWLFRDADHAISRYYYHKAHTPHAEFHFLFTFDTSKSDVPKQTERCISLIDKELEKQNEINEVKDR